MRYGEILVWLPPPCRHGGLQEAHFKDTFSKIITAKEIEGRNKENEPAAKMAKK